MNTEYFTRSEMEQIVSALSLEPGQTAHIHHCKPGRSNDRLYITRSDATQYLAYCHHCGKRGSYSTAKSANIHTLKAKRAALARSTNTDGSTQYKLPDDIDYDVGSWPSKARVWVGQYGITDREVAENRIGWSDYFHGVVLPVFDSSGLALYTVRLFDDSKGRKYYAVSNRPRAAWRSINRTTSDSVVVVEDILSGVKCSRLLSACALLNTHLHDEALYELTKHHDSFIIFLDDDNTQVRKKQLGMKRRLEAFGDVHIVHSGGRDPKEHSMEELERILL